MDGKWGHNFIHSFFANTYIHALCTQELNGLIVAALPKITDLISIWPLWFSVNISECKLQLQTGQLCQLSLRTCSFIKTSLQSLKEAITKGDGDKKNKSK